MSQKQTLPPIVNIHFTNYLPSKHEQYCQYFMLPLVESLLKKFVPTHNKNDQLQEKQR